MRRNVLMIVQMPARQCPLSPRPSRSSAAVWRTLTCDADRDTGARFLDLIAPLPACSHRRVIARAPVSRRWLPGRTVTVRLQPPAVCSLAAACPLGGHGRNLPHTQDHSGRRVRAKLPAQRDTGRHPTAGLREPVRPEWLVACGVGCRISAAAP